MLSSWDQCWICRRTSCQMEETIPVDWKEQYSLLNLWQIGLGHQAVDKANLRNNLGLIWLDLILDWTQDSLSCLVWTQEVDPLLKETLPPCRITNSDLKRSALPWCRRCDCCYSSTAASQPWLICLTQKVIFVAGVKLLLMEWGGQLQALGSIMICLSHFVLISTRCQIASLWFKTGSWFFLMENPSFMSEEPWLKDSAYKVHLGLT